MIILHPKLDKPAIRHDITFSDTERIYHGTEKRDTPEMDDQEEGRSRGEHCTPSLAGSMETLSMKNYSKYFLFH